MVQYLEMPFIAQFSIDGAICGHNWFFPIKEAVLAHMLSLFFQNWPIFLHS